MALKKKAAVPKGKAKAKGKAKVGKIEEDWLGDAVEDEDKLGALSDSEDDADSGEGAESSAGEGDDDAPSEAGSDGEAGALVAVGDGDGPERHRVGSKLLAKISEGAQPADLSQIKQRIQDAAHLLSDWQKAKKLGEKRDRSEVLKGLIGDCSTYYGYSEELAEYFLSMFSPDQAIQFFEANEKARPLTIRTNSLKARRQTLQQALTARKVQAEPVGAWTKVGLKVYEAAVPVGATPEYLGGQYMIQSASSFVPVMALAPQPDEVILDMAAAPGGKTTYIGQLMKNTGILFANDLRKERAKSVVANVHRMGLTNVITTCVDGRKLASMLPRMDRILLDAPCSGSGIIARDPSVKVKRGTKDFEESSRLQKELLATAIDMTNAESKTGGYIVYSTCSVSVEENEAVVQYALQARNVQLVSFSSAVNFGVEGLTRYRDRRFHPTMNLCRRYYPHVHNMDGFFVAKFKKLSNQIPERPKRQRGNDQMQVWGEEHWTPEMMETVLDFSPKPDPASVDKATAGMNKRDRKKLKRAAQLAARAAVTTAVGAAAVKAVAKTDTAGEEEPVPSEAGKGVKRPKKSAANTVGTESGTATEAASAAKAAAKAAAKGPARKKTKTKA